MDDGSLETLNASASDHLITEHGRLGTFHGWPCSAPVNPRSLAQAGFYYLGEADRVRCAFCGGTLKDWQAQDDPWREHTKHFSHCSFVKSHAGQNPTSHLSSQSHQNTPARTGQLQSHQSIAAPASHIQSVAHQNMPGLVGGIQEQSAQLGEPEISMGPYEVGRLNPRHPEYQSMDSRTQSFHNWPETAIQKPDSLADAGFFYTGQMDCVRCFCCGGALRNWEPTDLPWEEHARWFSRCPYLLQQKGRGFVAEMQRKYGSATARLPGTSSPASSPARRGTGDAEKLQRAMQSETVKEALNMGFTLQQVQTAVQKLLTTSGDTRVDLSKLVSVIVGEDIARAPQGGGEATSQHAQGEEGQSTRSGSDDRTLCKICMDRDVEVTFLPCGHLVCCAECSKHVKQCPVCRRTVKASIRTFLS